MGTEWYTGWCLEHQGLQHLAMFQMPGLGSHGKGVCHSSQNVKQGRQVKAVTEKEWKGITPILFLNQGPVAQLVGHANEVPVVIDGCEVTALIDLGVQVSNISTQLCENLGLKIQPLGWLLELEGTGGAGIPYLRFVEVNLQILGIRGYNEDVLLLAIPTMAYTEGVPVMVGSKIIDRALSCMTVGELAQATGTLQQAHFGQSCWGCCSYPAAAQINQSQERS